MGDAPMEFFSAPLIQGNLLGVYCLVDVDHHRRKGTAMPPKQSSKASQSRSKKSPSAKPPKKRSRVLSRRELIDTGTDKRFVRRSKSGRFKESDDVGRSLAADRRKRAKTKVKSGQGDRGDR